MSFPSRTSLETRARDLRFLVCEGGYWLASLGILLAGIVLLPFVALGVGLYAVPSLLEMLNRVAARAQGRAAGFSSAVLPFDRRRLTGRHSFTELAALLSSPETRRDVAWLLFHCAFAVPAAALALALPVGAVLYVVAAPFWPLFPPEAPLELTVAVTSWTDALLMILLGLGYAVAAWLLLPWMARRISDATLGILSPRRFAELSRRISDLSAARANALAAHAAELRRIERELHDGAQNRLVGVVMMLGLAQRAAETDPAAAMPFLGRAQDAAAEALAGLRAAVHDIYPPVLDELGLGGAAASLTSRSPVPCSLNTSGLRRAPAAVEAAAYFVLAEALTNAAKHADASRIDVVLQTESSPREDILVIQVNDDGRGGARAGSPETAGSAEAAGRSGTGLAGIARRAAAFGGKLVLASPDGGPTVVRVELPCAF
ncbi:histidine kinase [Arthrobacter sp. zg-Y820]|uniref:sensor histidine kinase n=1 Tax=unclassified Arthrobacter TaxID=235627 RepID=UPI0025426630|nr:MULTISPECIES: histidine kinase [unclassified Arthrobacter]MCC9196880.1 histidine kinase [Arthrobacter sp. zg-Y820]MDK1279744.1 histidine kinase [Arthrobacter sp. zg.Y820]WIB11000.1 histidine kinase [Arthrobacter sp. zg-Y820]